MHLFQQAEQEFIYLMPGDCFISIREKMKENFQLPLKHYLGVSIGIDLDIKQNSLTSYLESCECSLVESLKHICSGESHVVLRSSEAVKSFFGELYEVEEERRSVYLRVKLPELFYRMKYTKTESAYYDRCFVPRTQLELVKAVSDYIVKNLNEKIN